MDPTTLPEYRVFDDDLYESDDKLPEQPLLQKAAPQSVLSNVQLHLVESLDDVLRMFAWLGERREGSGAIAFDTETTGLDAQRDHIRLMQLGDLHTGWAIPTHLWAGAAIEALNRWDGPLLLHNSPFDVKFMEAGPWGWKAPWERIRDTMIGAHVVDPTQSVALKNLSVRLVDRRAAIGQTMLDEAFHKNGWNWATVPHNLPAYWAYAALDTVLTAHIDEITQAHTLYPEAYSLEMATRQVMSKVENNGMRIDIEYCEEKYAELLEKVKTIKKWGKDHFGIAMGSPAQLVDYFSSYDLEFSRFSKKTGKPSASKEQLKLWINDFSVPESLRVLADTTLTMRKYDRLAGSYFKNLLEMNVDGVVHPDIRTLGARTGRMSMKNPAMQTMPKREKMVRRAFIPHKEDEVIITCDFEQIEMRLFAHFSGDDDLCQAFIEADKAGEDGDFFTTMGREIFRDPSMIREDPRRDLVKNSMYGKIFGAGVEKMAESSGVPEDHMRVVVNALEARYPGLVKFQRKTEDLGQYLLDTEGTAYVTTPYGRRLPADSDRIYALTNYLMQGHAAEIIKRGSINIDNAGLGDYFINVVHDEVLLSVPRRDARDALQTVKECMEITEGYRVPLLAGPEGPFERWGGEKVAW